MKSEAEVRAFRNDLRTLTDGCDCIVCVIRKLQTAPAINILDWLLDCSPDGDAMVEAAAKGAHELREKQGAHNASSRH